MVQPLSTDPLSTVHVRDGDIITLGRWQLVQVNPRSEGSWQFQQFDVVFTTGETSADTIDRDGLDEIHETGEWGAFAIKRPQTRPPKLEEPDLSEPEEEPEIEEPEANEDEESPTDS